MASRRTFEDPTLEGFIPAIPDELESFFSSPGGLTLDDITGEPPSPFGITPRLPEEDAPAPSPFIPPATMQQLEAETGGSGASANTQSVASSQPFVQEGDTGGFLEDVGVTIGPGRSTTPDEAEAFVQEALAAGVPQSFIDSFLATDPGDYNRILEQWLERDGDDPGGGTTGGGGTGGGGTGTGGGGRDPGPGTGDMFGPGGPLANTSLDLEQLMALVNQINVEPGREVNLPAPEDLPVIEVPGINLSSDIDRSLLSIMQGNDTSTQETDAAIRQLLQEIATTERPTLPERELPAYAPIDQPARTLPERELPAYAPIDQPARTLPERELEDFFDTDLVTRRMLTATENAQLSQQGLLSQLRAQLGDAGTVGLPGVPQGLETAGARRVTERVAVPFAQELAEIQNQESERALDAALRQFGVQSDRDIAELQEGGTRDRALLDAALRQLGIQTDADVAELQEAGARDRALLEAATRQLDIETTRDIAAQQGHDARELAALELATGWSADKASRVLQAAAAGTDRQRILSEIALGTLDRNIVWNQFLFDAGMRREELAADIQAGRLDRVQNILNSFLALLAQLRGGFIGQN